MYVPPRPNHSEDPYFALRVGFMGALGLIVAFYSNISIAVMVLILPMTLIAGQRKAFQPLMLLINTLMLITLIWLLSALVVWTRNWPILFLLTMFLVYLSAIYVTRRTGSPVGMLVLVFGSILSIAGMKGPELIFRFSHSMTTGILVYAVFTPLLMWWFPPKTQSVLVQEMTGVESHQLAGAFIRASVLMVVSFWLYATLPVRDLPLAIAVVFVLVFPTKEASLLEASQRTLATFYGAIATVIALLILNINSTFIVLVLIFLISGIIFGHYMVHGVNEPVAYQYGYSVMMSLVISSLTTSTPGETIVMRILVTIAGILLAIFLTFWLERWLLKPIIKVDSTKSPQSQ